MKNIKYWETYNYYIMIYEGNENAAHAAAFSDLGYIPTTEEDEKDY